MSATFSHAIRVDRIPAAGKHVRIAADAAALKAIAELLQIAEVSDFTAEIEVRPVAGDSFTVRGKVQASVVQTDVVSLEPVRQAVVEEIDLRLVPEENVAGAAGFSGADALPEDRDVYRDGKIDLGAIAVEHLALGLDPYPRAAGSEFEGYVEDEPGGESSPFAALARLKHDRK